MAEMSEMNGLRLAAPVTDAVSAGRGHVRPAMCGWPCRCGRGRCSARCTQGAGGGGKQMLLMQQQLTTKQRAGLSHAVCWAPITRADGGMAVNGLCAAGRARRPSCHAQCSGMQGKRCCVGIFIAPTTIRRRSGHVLPGRRLILRSPLSQDFHLRQGQARRSAAWRVLAGRRLAWARFTHPGRGREHALGARPSYFAGHRVLG